MEKIITVGIPAYKAENHITNALGSIQMQTIKDKCSIIIASDNPADNYERFIKCYPDMDIRVLKCEKNTGPGLARQRCLDTCETPWITFIDADDSFMSPVSLQRLAEGITPDCIEVQGVFYQEVEPNPSDIKMIPRNDVTHPWVFGRLYNVGFLKQNKIGFSSLRAMEDGELNWKVKMSIEGSPLKINVIQDPTYFWRIGSEHSITRTGIKENDGIPLYNWDLCLVGSTVASINAIDFCKKANPFNGNVTRFTVDSMIGQYFSYVQCLDKKPMFAKQCLFNAKRFYHCAYKFIENSISEDILKQLYTAHYAGVAQDMIGIIPSITFFDFLEKIKTEEYKGKEEFDAIRKELPSWVIDLDMKTGVLGEEGYIYSSVEKEA